MAEVILERMRILAELRLSERMITGFAASPEITMDYWLDLVVFQLRQHVMGRVADEIEVRYPADWWQAFKQRWYPAWALTRWPVRETVVKLMARELYPKIAMPSEPHYINLTREFVGCKDAD